MRAKLAILFSVLSVIGLTVGIFASSAGAVVLPNAVSDQQDVTTNGSGIVTVRFDEGDPVLGVGTNTCLSGKPTIVVQAASTLTAGKAQIVTHRERFNTTCSFQLTANDKFGNPITNAEIRIAYIAVVQGQYSLP
jgi:hypothetical protein